MATGERLEIAIPKWSIDLISATIVFAIVVLATAVALLELFFRVAIIMPCIWLAIMAMLAWSSCQGGVRKCFINLLGLFAHKHFLETVPKDRGSVEIRYGYQLLGHRLCYFKLPLHKIESVQWSPGQNPVLWHVAVWYDHDDPEKSLRQNRCHKPDQEVSCIGPSRAKGKTEMLGLAVIDLFRRAGAQLIQGKDECTFVRDKSVD